MKALLRQPYTFDTGRDATHPCTFCGVRPPRAHRLREIGVYPNGETLTRPVCGGCAPIATALERQRRICGPLTPSPTETAARRELWLKHHNGSTFGLYGDDGEMQCNRPGCGLDFKRMPLDELMAHTMRVMNEYAAAVDEALRTR